MYVNEDKKISCKNFHCFAQLKLDLDQRCVVLVGDNGSGKTSILQMIRYAVGTYISLLTSGDNIFVNNLDVRYSVVQLGKEINREYNYPLEITTVFNLNDEEIFSTILFDNLKCEVLHVKRDLFEYTENIRRRLPLGDKGLILPVIAYYGTGRLWKHDNKVDELNPPSSRLEGYTNCLEADLDEKKLLQWFKKMTYMEIQNGEEIKTISKVKTAMAKCYKSILGEDEIVEVRYGIGSSEIEVIVRNTEGFLQYLPLRCMSDGIRVSMTLVADIAYRMAVLNPQLEDDILDKTDGVVIIDEVDLHLHPEWQQHILDDLMRLFPRVQFIVTTHAPAVINSVHGKNLIMLRDYQPVYTDNVIYGSDINNIVTGVMESTERPKSVKDIFSKFYKAIDSDDLKLAEDYIEKLNEKIGGNDPELASCKMKLKLALTRRRGDLTCDSKRENRLLKVNPLDAKTLKYVSYTSNGVIYSDDEVIQNDLDVKLNLNCKSAGINLPLQRKMVLDEIQS